MKLSQIVMMNTKYKMNIHGVVNWFDSDEFTIFKATRLSNRNVIETIYILGAGIGYSLNSGDRLKYVTDTGKGYGGKGELIIYDIMVSGKKYGNNIVLVQNKTSLNEVIKLPVWVLK